MPVVIAPFSIWWLCAGNRRGGAPEESAPVLDLGLGADPLGGDQLGDPLTAHDLEDPLVAATLEDAWFGGASGAAADGRKAKGSPGTGGAAAAWEAGRGREGHCGSGPL